MSPGEDRQTDSSTFLFDSENHFPVRLADLHYKHAAAASKPRTQRAKRHPGKCSAMEQSREEEAEALTDDTQQRSHLRFVYWFCRNVQLCYSAVEILYFLPVAIICVEPTDSLNI